MQPRKIILADLCIEIAGNGMCLQSYLAKEEEEMETDKTWTCGRR